MAMPSHNTELAYSPKHARDACLVRHSEDDQSEHLRDEFPPEMNPCLSHRLLHAQNFTKSQSSAEKNMLQLQGLAARHAAGLIQSHMVQMTGG